MNAKEAELNKIIDLVLDCCRHECDDNESITREKLLGQCREENVIMTRCILARVLAFSGYTNTTISIILHKSIPAVRNILEMAREYRKMSRAYRIAEDEVGDKYKNLCESN